MSVVLRLWDLFEYELVVFLRLKNHFAVVQFFSRYPRFAVS